MDKVFITHSRHDAPILEHIAELIKIVGVEPILYRYDYKHTDTAWQEIRYDIYKSHALFVVLSNNLSASSHTQNWVGWEVGVACAYRKRVWVFEELNRIVSFPIPYLTDYVPYDLSNPQLRQLISAVARGYRLRQQFMSTVGVAGIGGLLFGLPGLVIGAIIGNIAGRPEQAPYINLMCYHLGCKTRFNMYLWLDEFKCPACRRTLRFRREELKDGGTIIYPKPYPIELAYSHYVWYDERGQPQLFEP